MATRVVEGKKPYTGGKAISIDENKVISLNLRDENNLIIYDEGDDEIYVDLQLDDEITPTSAFPIGVNVGRVIVDNGWDKPGTIISAETTSGDNIKIFYADEGTLWIDNGTGTFKQIYFKADVDTLLSTLRNYIDGELAKKQNGVSSDTAPSNPSEGDLWYDTTNSAMKVWDGTAWQSVGTGGGGSDIVYATQAEYNALLPGAASDGKHYFIYSTSGGGGWQPGVNTIAYYPLTSTSTTSDMSGNGYTLSKSGSGNTAFGNYGGISCLYIENTATYYSAITTVSASGGLTMNIWYYSLNTPQYDNAGIIRTNNTNPVTTNYNRCISIIHANGRPDNKYGIAGFADDGTNVTTTTYNITNGSWHNLCITFGGTTGILYVDGVQIGTLTKTMGYDQQNYISISKRTLDFDRSIRGYLSEAIFENKVRTAQEVSDYFNQTKSNYGIS